MEKIASFTINHLKLLRGVYVSRQDNVKGNVITTFDLRMKRPNYEPVMNTAEMHAIEHLAATFLRNHETWQEDVIYFGPMGCRTGFYLILAGDLKSEEIVDLLKEMYDFIIKFDDEIPGATAIDCGNYHDMNLPMAKYESEKYLKEVLENISDDRLKYPV